VLARLRIALLGAWWGSLLSYGAFGVYRAFEVLPTYLAAEFLRGGFDGLDRAGAAIGVACALLALPQARRRARPSEWLRALAPLGGSACHALSYAWITPELAALRQSAGGTIGQLAAGHPSLARFELLHQTSRGLYFAAALLGLGVCIWDLVATRSEGFPSHSSSH
jgi:hypothetical protein